MKGGMGVISFKGFEPTGSSPIYLQIIKHIKVSAVSGDAANGDELPSRRSLSAMLGINPTTVQKAYRELERQGYVYTTSGVGTFVADRSEIHADLPALQKAQENLDDAFRQLLFLGIGYEKAKNLTMQIIERRRPDHDKN